MEVTGELKSTPDKSAQGSATPQQISVPLSVSPQNASRSPNPKASPGKSRVDQIHCSPSRPPAVLSHLRIVDDKQDKKRLEPPRAGMPERATPQTIGLGLVLAGLPERASIQDEERLEAHRAGPIDVPAVQLPHEPPTAMLTAITAMQESKQEPSRPQRLVLREVELQKLHQLDVNNQSFSGCIWMEFHFPGGAHDEHLSREPLDKPHFPLDPQTGKPTFKPNAAWYMAQMDSRNALSWELMEGKIMRRGDDLVMSIRVRGSFTEIFEIHDYPCDCQGTTITLNFNCRANGPLPIRLSVDPSCKVSMTAINLCPPKIEFSLENALYMRAHLIGHGERTFPGISFTAKVIRKPFHSLLFVVCPYAFLSLLSVLANGIRGTDPVVRSVRALHTLVIVLAAASYRVALSASLPNIGYLTMLDRYCLWACGVILLCALQSRIQMIRIGELTESDLQEIGIPDERFTGVFDLAGIALLTAIWLWVHISYAYVFWKFSKEPRVRDQALSDAKFIKFDECIVPPLRPSQEQGSFANLRQITRAASSFRAASKRSSSSPLKQ